MIFFVPCAQAYILVNHPFADAAEGASKMRTKGWQDAGGVDEALGFAPTELFDLFQRQRQGHPLTPPHV